jgi:uncharacterized protein YndB with AHSA1/START domain
MTAMTLTLQGETQVVVRRRFAAPPAKVFAAHVDPALLPRWMTGPPGWVMTACHCDARPGGTMRLDWASTDGSGPPFHATAEFLEVTPFVRIVHVERMFLPDPTPDNHVETLFAPDGTGTILTMIMTLADADSRTAMLATGMEEGMEISYARIDDL